MYVPCLNRVDIDKQTVITHHGALMAAVSKHHWLGYVVLFSFLSTNFEYVVK
jgi:hypothetical protein